MCYRPFYLIISYGSSCVIYITYNFNLFTYDTHIKQLADFALLGGILRWKQKH